MNALEGLADLLKFARARNQSAQEAVKEGRGRMFFALLTVGAGGIQDSACGTCNEVRCRWSWQHLPLIFRSFLLFPLESSSSSSLIIIMADSGAKGNMTFVSL